MERDVIDDMAALLRAGQEADPTGVAPTAALQTSALLMNVRSVETLRDRPASPERQKMLEQIQRQTRAAAGLYRRLLSAAEALDVDVAEALEAVSRVP